MNIREMRAQLGDTQSEFSARYHIPFRTVQNWETGMRKPPEYVADLLEQRIKEDLTNRKTLSLPKYDPQKEGSSVSEQLCGRALLAASCP